MAITKEELLGITPDHNAAPADSAPVNRISGEASPAPSYPKPNLQIQNPAKPAVVSQPIVQDAESQGDHTSTQTNNASGSRTVEKIESVSTSSSGSTEKPHISMVDLIDKLYADNRPETPEQRAEREKREKREAIFAAIGDGISALSNLFFTTKGSPNAYDPSQGMSARTKARWDRLRAERQANNKAYFDAYLRAYQLDRGNEREERMWKHSLEREKIADDRYNKKEARDNELHPYNVAYHQKRAEEAGHKARQAEVSAQYAEDAEELKLENLRAGVRQKNAAAGASHAKGNYYNNGGSGGGKKRPHLVLDGATTYYDTDEDYKRTVERYADEYGINRYVTVMNGGPIAYSRSNAPKTKSVKKSIDRLAAEVEAENAKRQVSAKGKGYGDTNEKNRGY